MDDLSRQAAIDALFELDVSHWVSWEDAVIDLIDLLPSAQPDLTESDWRLIKQMRSNYNGTYAKVIDRLIASAQPEIIRCKDCKFWQDQEEGVVEVPICARPQNKFEKHPMVMIINGDGYCSFAKRRTDESDDIFE